MNWANMKKQILFVDDDGFVLSALRRLLFSYRDHWDVDFIRSGEKALRCMNERPYDVVVSDMRMPGMDGSELLENVRQRFPTTIRIILSGQSDDQVGLDALGPAHQYFAKPCDPQLLKATINRLSDLQRRIGDESLLNLVSQVESLPSLPIAFAQFQAELNSVEPSIERIAEIVNRDIAMTAKVSQLVSSTGVGLGNPLTDPIKAAKFLGLEHLQPLARSIHVFSPLQQLERCQFDFSGLADHSAAVARLAREITLEQFDDPQLGDDAYLAGMLHDIGQLIMAVGYQETYQEVLGQAREAKSSLWKMEQQRWSTSHADIGAYLCGLWGLPDPIVQAIAYHHEPSSAPSQSDSTALTAVHVADTLIHEQQDETGFAEFDSAYIAQQRLTDFVESLRERQFEVSQ